MVNVDVHSIYSIKKSLLSAQTIVDEVKKNDQKAVILCDDNALYGAIDFYAKCIKGGIKPGIGVQFNICESITVKDRSVYSITLIAKNIDGYRNLCKLITESYSNGFYYVPRIDWELLKIYANNLLCVLTAKTNPIYRTWFENQNEYMELIISRLTTIFGNDIHYVLNPYSSGEYRRYIKFITANFSNSCCISNHARFLGPDQYDYYDMMFCIRNKVLYGSHTRDHADPDEFFRSENELLKFNFGIEEHEVKRYVDSTNAIMDKIDLQFEKKFHFPKIKEKQDSDRLLKHLISEGWKQRRRDVPEENHTEYKKRIKYETEAIIRLGYADYFIIVSDFVVWAKHNGVPVGPGRGSAAGSIVSYLLNITTVDPIKYGLLFERFLDPTGQRISLPDIDIDFGDADRDRVLKYITEVFGNDRVACVGNISTLAFKSSIKDTAKAMGITFERANNYTRNIPFFIRNATELKEYKKFKPLLQGNKELQKLLHFSDGVSGSMKNLSTHAAGVLITPTSITDFTPIEPIEKGGKIRLTTQLNKDSVEFLGLLKMDLLGLTALSTIKNTIDMVRDRHGIDIDIDRVDMDDEEIYKHILDGHTTGIFQLESDGMTTLAKDIQVSSLSEICDLIALYRPAILQSNLHLKYIENKFSNSRQSIHDAISEITSSTYGILLYQEQVMQASVKMAKFTLPEADTLRKAIGKKSTKDIPVLREKFVKGCVKNKIEESEAEEVFAIFEDAGYMFNKSHSLSYSIIAAQTAWLKTYYPLEFMCSYLNSEAGDLEKLTTIVKECHYLGIDVLPPDINKSQSMFCIEGSNIRYALSTIKEIGLQDIDAIINVRNKSGDILDFDIFLNDLSKHANLSALKAKLMVLIQCGVFDSVNPNRNKLLSKLDSASNIDKRLSGKTTKVQLFDISILNNGNDMKINDIDIERKRMFEREYLGIQYT